MPFWRHRTQSSSQLTAPIRITPNSSRATARHYSKQWVMPCSTDSTNISQLNINLITCCCCCWDLLEQPLDFYEPDVLPATLPIMSKHHRKPQWFGHLLFYTHGISTPYPTNSVIVSLSFVRASAYPGYPGSKGHKTVHHHHSSSLKYL